MEVWQQARKIGEIPPALSAAGTALTAVAAGIVMATNATGTGLIKLGTAVETSVPAFAVLAGSMKTAGAALEAFSPSLGGVAVRPGDRPAGHSGPVASRGVQALLYPQESGRRVGRPTLDRELVGLIRKTWADSIKGPDGKPLYASTM